MVIIVCICANKCPSILTLYYGIVLVPTLTEASFSPKEEICEENTDMTNDESQQLINSMYPEVRKCSLAYPEFCRYVCICMHSLFCVCISGECVCLWDVGPGRGGGGEDFHSAP